jgi:AcrR family transcriptional regulator
LLPEEETVPTTDHYHHGDLKNALIQAGVDILASEGVGGLTLRKAAKQAHVSHAAPYAHFADKQELIAAISTEGYRKVYERMDLAGRTWAGDPLRVLVETAWAYVEFARDEPAHFQVTLSGVVEREQDYPPLVEATQECFGLLRQVVLQAQRAHVLRPGPADLLAVSVWGAVHGLAMLVLNGQISHTILESFTMRQMLVFTLQQYCLVEIPEELEGE